MAAASSSGLGDPCGESLIGRPLPGEQVPECDTALVVRHHSSPRSLEATDGEVVTRKLPSDESADERMSLAWREASICRVTTSPSI